MPKTYTEGHKAREITLAEAAIVKLRDGLTAAVTKHETEREKGKAMHVRANALIEAADRKLNGQDWDRKIDAAEAHLAWLRAMPVPPADELPAAEA